MNALNLNHFPVKYLSAPRLQIIEIQPAENLKMLPKRMQTMLPSLNNMLIINCPKVEMFPERGLPSNVKDVSLSSLKIMASLRETLGAKKCLKSWTAKVSTTSPLTLHLCPSLQCLPEVGLPKSIPSLSIWKCPLLKPRWKNIED